MFSKFMEDCSLVMFHEIKKWENLSFLICVANRILWTTSINSEMWNKVYYELKMESKNFIKWLVCEGYKKI
jgi:hypothetical protein